MTSPPERRTLRWLLPALILLAWFAVAAVGGPFAGMLGQVQTNDSSAFLPAEAESTRVAEIERTFAESALVPAVIVAERAAGITQEDREYVRGVVGSSTSLTGVDPAVSSVLASDDGRAVRAVVGVDTTGDPAETVEQIRDRLAQDPPAGLRIFVTGPAGQIADLTAAFAGIDTTLLLVAGGVVIVILIIVYRSPLLPLIVVLSAIFALALASAVIYLLADTGVIVLNGQSQGILFILVFGAATDYALLLVARYREELHDPRDRLAAMWRTLRAVREPIAASAGTVILGVLCLLVSDLNSNRSLGPVAAIGIAASLIASLTFLPAALAVFGRAAFWPLRPKTETPAEEGFWWRLSRRVSAHRTVAWSVTALLLVACAGFLPQLKSSGVAQSEVFLTKVDSVVGQEVVSAHFPGGSGAPTVIISNADRADAVVDAVRQVEGVSPTVTLVGATEHPDAPPKVVDGRVEINAVLTAAPDSEAAVDTVRRIRDAVHAVPDADALVGGPTAVQLDTQTTAARDRAVIIPLVLVLVFAVLALLLRALVAPLLLIATVVLSFAATLGISALVFNHVFGFPGSDPVVPLFGFVFLVALGVDYNIFLMTRVREESARSGTETGVRRGLAVTGGVITSAGIVLAATFGALAVIPLIFLVQLAFIVSFGVLLDALVVRAILVPALALQIGPAVWWPSALARPSRSKVRT
ncbi:MAG: MMPL family transporter [Rhodococcus sp.]|nr:MMPL family transporter [Rhodococcus sp. (in: high G+C Gram-positive bacteria)]